jgi:CRP/FNR family cyclic AMP-dependent transcriptional regulator
MHSSNGPAPLKWGVTHLQEVEGLITAATAAATVSSTTTTTSSASTSGHAAAPSRSMATPIALMSAQIDCEVLTLPTGAKVFSKGMVADSIYGVRLGIVELLTSTKERLCYRPGELFSYQDIIWREEIYRSEAVELLRLDRLRFLNLLHNHPTLAILLIGQQHDRLREQRTSGTCCY